MFFRMGGHLAEGERWVYDDEEVKVTNGYKYLWITFPTKRCINFVLSQVCKKGAMEIQTLCFLGSFLILR